MKQIKNNNITNSLFLLMFIFISACDRCGFSERCYNDRIREKFIRLSPEERKKARDWCREHEGCWMSIHKEPTPEELKKLKIDNE